MGEYIRNSTGKFIGTTQTDKGKTIVRDFSGKIVATYDANSNITVDWTKNQSMRGNQAIRFLK